MVAISPNLAHLACINGIRLQLSTCMMLFGHLHLSWRWRGETDISVPFRRNEVDAW